MTATATKKTRASRSRGKAATPAAGLPPTLGPRVCAWIERYLVHGEGDYFGQPVKLRPWQKALIYRAYELKPDGSRRWRHVLWGLPKGNGKTELAAMVSTAELAGPVVCDGFDANGKPIGVPRTSPLIPVAAASFEQADLVYGASKVMVREGPLNELCEVYDTEILLKGRPGRLYRVAAVAGTNDGGKPSFGARDELHEWTGNKERVHLVLQNNLAKRTGTWGLDISTAGWDLQSVLGRAYQRGVRIREGKEQEGDFLMVWYEAPRELDLADPAQFEQACHAANPALGDFLSLENLRARYLDMPEFEFRRYHLNQWVSTPARWLPAGAWERRAAETAVAPQSPITLALEGDWDGESIALVGCTLAKPRHLFVLERWEKTSSDAPDWRPPTIETLKAAIRRAGERYNVQAIGANRSRWPELFNDLEVEGLPVVEWSTHVTARIAPACKQLYDSVVVSEDVTQDGTAPFALAFENALVKEDHHDRVWITRSPAAIAAVIANDLAVRTPDGTSVYETRGALVL